MDTTTTRSSLPRSVSATTLVPEPSFTPLDQRAGSFLTATLVPQLDEDHEGDRNMGGDGGMVVDGGGSVDPLYRAVREAGTRAVDGVEVWVLRRHYLVHAATWVDVGPGRRQASRLETLWQELPVPQVPGAGLAGYFWSTPSTTNMRRSGGSASSSTSLWRELGALTSDPFQAPDSRTALWQEAGMVLAAGVPFDIPGAVVDADASGGSVIGGGSFHRGVVIYLSADPSRLRNFNDYDKEREVTYLVHAAHSIGAASAMAESRRALMESKTARVDEALRRVRAKLLSLHECMKLYQRHSQKKHNVDELHIDAMEEGKRRSNLKGTSPLSSSPMIEKNIPSSPLVRAFKEYLEKTRGSQLRPPPSATITSAAWTFLGVYATVYVLVHFSALCKRYLNHSMVMPPFGALLTLQFGLTAAPPSQPRNVLYGQLVSLTVALMAQHYLSYTWNFSHPIVLSAAAATGISAMTLAGVTHPPAAAAILALFGNGTHPFSLETCAIFYAGNIIAVGMAVLVNNLSDQRRYPVYWNMCPPPILPLPTARDYYSFLSKARSLLRAAVDGLDEKLESLEKQVSTTLCDGKGDDDNTTDNNDNEDKENARKMFSSKKSGFISTYHATTFDGLPLLPSPPHPPLLSGLEPTRPRPSFTTTVGNLSSLESVESKSITGTGVVGDIDERTSERGPILNDCLTSFLTHYNTFDGRYSNDETEMYGKASSY